MNMVIDNYVGEDPYQLKQQIPHLPTKLLVFSREIRALYSFSGETASGRPQLPKMRIMPSTYLALTICQALVHTLWVYAGESSLLRH